MVFQTRTMRVQYSQFGIKLFTSGTLVPRLGYAPDVPNFPVRIPLNFPMFWHFGFCTFLDKIKFENKVKVTSPKSLGTNVVTCCTRVHTYMCEEVAFAKRKCYCGRHQMSCQAVDELLKPIILKCI